MSTGCRHIESGRSPSCVYNRGSRCGVGRIRILTIYREITVRTPGEICHFDSFFFFFSVFYVFDTVIHLTFLFTNKYCALDFGLPSRGGKGGVDPCARRPLSAKSGTYWASTRHPHLNPQRLCKVTHPLKRLCLNFYYLLTSREGPDRFNHELGLKVLEEGRTVGRGNHH